MTLPVVLALVAATVILSPILVRVMDRKAGAPVASSPARVQVLAGARGKNMPQMSTRAAQHSRVNRQFM